MCKLLRAGFARLKHDIMFFICLALMFAIGLFIAVKTGAGFALERTFFVYMIPLGFASAAFCALFIGAEYSDGTIRNKLIVGASRTAVYLSNFIVCSVAGLAMCAAYMLAMFAVGVQRLGFFQMGALPALAIIGVSFVLTLAFAAVFTLVAMLCDNKAVTAVICVLGIVALLFTAAWLNGRINEPEYHDNYVYTDNAGGIATGEPTPNPNYLTGVKRQVFQFFLDFLPTGQALMLMELSMTRVWPLPLYSLLIVVLTTAAGMCVFKKKDIK